MFTRILSAFVIVLLSTISAFAADPYTVTNVHVDATANNALEAQTLAVSQGQIRAANILIERMSLASERASKGFQGVSQADGAKMIRALEIANEKRSSNRYLGDITVAFNPNAISQYMRVKGLTLVATQSRRRLVIPVLDGAGLWSDNEWAQAWQTAQFENALTPMGTITPRPGLERFINDRSAKSPSLKNLQAIGKMFGVEQVLIAVAQPTYQGYTVRLKDVALDSGASRTLGPLKGVTAETAALAVVSALEKDWKTSSVTTSSSKSVSMPVSVLYRSQAEWLQLQDVINGAAQIRSARLEAMSKRGASMVLTYGGDIERLRTELAYKGVRLDEDENLGMVLSRTGAF